MKVFVFPADLGGCGYYRLIWPSKVLQKAGYDVTVVHPKHHSQVLTGDVDRSGKLVGVNVPHCDVVVFQRVSSEKIADVITILRKNHVAVVLDIDDDMRAIDQRNPAWTALHPKSATTQEYNWNNAQRAYDVATYVTVSSDALLERYARPHRVDESYRGEVLHNYIPEILTQIPHTPEANTIGWGGSMHSHPDDPQVVGSSMGRIAREGYTFKIVGPARGTRSAFQLDAEPPSSGAVAIQNYPHELTKLSVGIAPLNATRFNEAKSWLKMLEYAALGVPCIGSPRAEYTRINALGVGLLASTPRDWYRHARRLLDDESYRTELSEAGRAAVAQLTIERNAHRWWEAWSKALGIERGVLGIKPTRATVPDQT